MIEAAVAVAAEYLADAVAIVGAGDAADRLSGQVAALMAAERVTVDELVVVAARAPRGEPGNDRGLVEASAGRRVPAPPAPDRSG
jgi:hypothetical protein